MQVSHRTGIPMHTGQMFVLGSVPKLTLQSQKALVSVFSWTCVSMPMTASNSDSACNSDTYRATLDPVQVDIPGTVVAKEEEPYAVSTCCAASAAAPGTKRARRLLCERAAGAGPRVEAPRADEGRPALWLSAAGRLRALEAAVVRLIDGHLNPEDMVSSLLAQRQIGNKIVFYNGLKESADQTVTDRRLRNAGRMAAVTAREFLPADACSSGHAVRCKNEEGGSALDRRRSRCRSLKLQGERIEVLSTMQALSSRSLSGVALPSARTRQQRAGACRAVSCPVQNSQEPLLLRAARGQGEFGTSCHPGAQAATSLTLAWACFLSPSSSVQTWSARRYG